MLVSIYGLFVVIKSSEIPQRNELSNMLFETQLHGFAMR